MTSERALWNVVRDRLSPFGRLERVENRLNLGTPDVSYALRRPAESRGVSGWVELKENDPPVRATTPFSIESLKLEQVRWQEDWAEIGRVATILQVRRDYLVLAPSVVRAVYERLLTTAQLYEAAAVVGRGRFPTGDILRWLT